MINFDYYNFQQYYKQFVGLQGDEIIYNLIQYLWSWDNYSIGIMYLKLLLYTFDTNTNKTLNYLKIKQLLQFILIKS